MRDEIIRLAEQKAPDGQLACADAMTIASQLEIAPIEVGKTVNRASNLRFYRCQLGLFGYGSKVEGKHKIVLAATVVPEAIKNALLERAHDDRIACQDVWQVAEEFGYPRLGVSNVVEALGLAVRPCQLGCF